MSVFSRIAFGTLIAGALVLGGCDKEKAQDGQPPAGQNIVTDGTVPEGTSAQGADTAKENYTIDRSRKGKAIADLRFTGEDDAAIAISDYRGKPLLLNLWATWCGPCVVEMPALDSLAGTLAGKVAVVAVSQDLKGAEPVDAFFAKTGLKHLKPFIDPENKLGQGLEVGALPTTILIDKDGKEVLRVNGALDWTGKEAAALIAEAG